jgi:hypothetical protein
MGDIVALSWRAQESLMQVAKLALKGSFSESRHSPLLIPPRLAHVLTFSAAEIYKTLRGEFESLSLGHTSLRVVDKKALRNPTRKKDALFFTTCPNMTPEGVILVAPHNHWRLRMRAFTLTSQMVVRQSFKE